MTADSRFPELVSLACHDVRTPLATVAGFAATLLRLGNLDAQGERYIGLIEAAARQIADITDELSVAARIAGGRFDPTLETHDSLEIANEAAERLGDGKASASGEGAPVFVDRAVCVRAVAGIAYATLRHGGLSAVALRVDGPSIAIAPLADTAAPVALGDDVRDLGAVAGRAALEAIGARVAAEDGALLVRLPAPDGTA